MDVRGKIGRTRPRWSRRSTSLVDDVLDRFPQLEEMFHSALVSPEQKEQLLDRVFGKRWHRRHVLNFLKVLSRHGRLGTAAADRSHCRKAATPSGAALTDVEVRVAAPNWTTPFAAEIRSTASQSARQASPCCT